ncbi:hypothetical protein [Calothrix rhizosoleniae]|uniref:hypothetical protein n=1 Tax=Calothrix rhizosoleniae TaxID=888997 RepID=UPI000B4A1477|nr:hypothetical protein [Calothrix rhizosoleniae]
MSTVGFWQPIYQLFEPEKPLATSEELNNFYVQRKNSPVERLVTLISLQQDPAKFLLAGHRGSGKTTELRRLQQKLGYEHTVIWIDAEFALNKFNAGYAEVVILIGLEIYNQAKKSDWKLDRKLYNNLENSLKTVVKVESQNEEGAFKLPEVMEKVGLLLKRGFDRQQTRTLNVLPVLNDIIKNVNSIIKAAEDKRLEKLLVIVDGLDKHERRTTLDMFCRSSLLAEPECHIIYSIPLELRHSTEYSQAKEHFDECLSLNNLPVFHCDDNLRPTTIPHDYGRQTMKKIIDKRLQKLDRGYQNKTIFDTDALEEIAEKSGGVNRDLVRLARTCCEVALRHRKDLVDAEVAKEAVNKERQVYNLNDYQFPVLLDIHYTGKLTTKTHSLPHKGEFIICDELLQNKSILGYEHEIGNAWFDVNPILMEDLERWQKGNNK